MHTLTFRALIAASLLAGSAVVLSASPTAAAASLQHVSANLFGDSRPEIVEYRQGTGTDYVFAEFSNVIGSITYIPYSINTDLVDHLFAGDFDGDGYDELFFYGAGAGIDQIWDFDGPTTITVVAVSAGSLRYPVPGDFTGDGAEDILWYAPGAVSDEIWEFNPGSFAFTSLPFSLAGDYLPLSGDFTGDGADDVVFYGRGSVPDLLYDFDPGALAHRFWPIGPAPGDARGFTPFTLDIRHDGVTDIFWYHASAADVVFDFHANGYRYNPYNASGVFTPVTGDFFGDGHDDIFWFANQSWLWNFRPGAGGTVELTQEPFGA